MRLHLIAFAAATVLASSVGAARAADQDFRLVNRTGFQIDEVFVSRHSASEWGRDVMGDDSLGDGETVKITFPRKTEACKFDIKVKYHDDDTAEWGNIDLCEASKITLFWEHNKTRAVTE